MNKVDNITYLVSMVHRDHEDIERMLGHLSELALRGDAATAGGHILSKITEFWAQHILNEERLMNLLEYQDIGEHSVDHNKILVFASDALSLYQQLTEATWSELIDNFGQLYKKHLEVFDRPLLTAFE